MILTKKFLSLSLSKYTLHQGTLDVPINISVDSRTIKPGEIFLALSGVKTDGHKYLEQALKNGASGLIVEHVPNINTQAFIIEVPDTLMALKQMAIKARECFTGEVVGITGSVGKTTTKEMLRFIMPDTFVSYGNQNSNIGLSINLLKLSDTYKYAIFEMGINDNNEMDELVLLARPTISAITWISGAHLEGLGDTVNIAKEKSKIFLTSRISIIPDQQFFQSEGKIVVGRDVFAKNIKIEQEKILFDLSLFGKEASITIPCENRSFISNALVAAAIAHSLGVSLKNIVLGLSKFEPVDGRFKRKKMKGDLGYLIDDSYNASPDSMKIAIEAFNSISSNANKVMVLGDMLELGKDTADLHYQLAKQLVSCNAKIILVGKHLSKISSLIPGAISIDSWKDFDQSLLKPNSFVLFKGSNSIGLKNIISYLV